MLKRMCVGLTLGLGLLTGCAGYYEIKEPAVTNYLPQERGAMAASKPAGQSREAAREKPLSLEACVRIALAENPAAAAASEGVAVAGEAVGQARAAYYPEIELHSGYRRFQNHIFLPPGLGGTLFKAPTTIGPLNDWSEYVSMRYYLFDSGERRARLLEAKAKLGVARQEEARIKQDMVLNVHQAYYSCLSSIELRSVARKELVRAEDHRRLAAQRVEAGVALQTDVLRAQVEVSNLKLALLRAENIVRISRGNLNTSMGLPVETPLEVEAPSKTPVSPNGINIEEAFEQAVQRRPEVRGALLNISAAQSGVEEARSAFGPRIRAEGNVGRRDSVFWPNDKDWHIGVFVDWSLFTGFSRTHGFAKATREVSRQEAETRQLIQIVRQQVWTAHSRLLEAFEAVEATRTLVKDAAESMRETRQRYEAGTNTITDLLDSQTSLVRAEANHVQAQWDYFTSKAEFDRATGLLAANDYTR